mgnify:CR=1 FL=1|jgi:hypothetical protein
MAIKVNGTTVINDSRVLSDVTGLKTVGGTSILGSGNIDAGASTAVNGVGTYTLAYDTGMADGTTDSQAQWKVYKEGRTVSGSALRGRAALCSSQNGLDRQATSTSGTDISAVLNSSNARNIGTVTSNQTYSGSWRLMSPGANKSNRSSFTEWAQVYTGLWVRYS